MPAPASSFGSVRLVLVNLHLDPKQIASIVGWAVTILPERIHASPDIQRNSFCAILYIIRIGISSDGKHYKFHELVAQESDYEQPYGNADIKQHISLSHHFFFARSSSKFYGMSFGMDQYGAIADSSWNHNSSKPYQQKSLRVFLIPTLLNTDVFYPGHLLASKLLSFACHCPRRHPIRSSTAPLGQEPEAWIEHAPSRYRRDALPIELLRLVVITWTISRSLLHKKSQA